jgi:hypothetical protein
MSWHAIDSVDEAIEETQSFLSPLELRRWAKLALISIFVGTGGGSVFSFLNSGSSIPSGGPTGNESAGAPMPAGNETVPGTVPSGEVPPPAQLFETAQAELAIIAAIVAVLVGIGLVIALISDILRFVFYDDLQTDEVRLIEPAKRRFGQALRLFGFKLVVQLLTLAPFAAVVAYFILNSNVPVGPGVIVLGGLLAAGILLVSTVVSRITSEFVVPTMVVTDSGVLDGWRRFWPVLRGQLAQFGVYLVVHFLLLLAIGIAQAIISVLVYGIVLTIGGVIGLVIVFGVFGGVSAVAASHVALVLLGLLALVTLVIGWVLLLPVQVAVLTYVTTYEVAMLGAADEELRLRPESDSSGTDDSAAVVE